MLNSCCISGRLCKDPEVRTTANDMQMATFTIACERDFKGKDGKKETDFFPVLCFRNTADFVAKYGKKGRMAVVQGRMQVNSWEGDDGKKHSRTEIIANSVYFTEWDNKPQGSADDDAITVDMQYAPQQQSPNVYSYGGKPRAKKKAEPEQYEIRDETQDEFGAELPF